MTLFPINMEGILTLPMPINHYVKAGLLQEDTSSFTKTDKVNYLAMLKESDK